MREKLRTIIKEYVSKIFENFEDDEFNSFDFEDIPDMKPGGAAHQAFLDDLKKEPSFGSYKEPNEQELKKIIQGLKQANLDLPSEQELIQQAKEMLKRNLNPSELEKIQKTKERMEKIMGAGSFNESNEPILELDHNLISDPKQISMAKKIMGDNSIIVLNKLQLGEELTLKEMEEARDKYLTDYIFTKAKLNKEKRILNPINLEDLEAIFDIGGYILNGYLTILVNKYSNVNQISTLERTFLLNTGGLDTPINANNNIAKKYIIKMLLNLDVPQGGDNKWTTEDSIEAIKAYQIALTDNEFRELLWKILSQKGKQNSKLYKKLEKNTLKEPNKELE